MKDIGNKDTITKLKTKFLGYPGITLGIHEVLYIDTIRGIASAKYIANLIGIKFNLYTRWPNNLSLEQKKSIDVWFNNREFINFF